jgi:V-type H+-transporting ATPase subunit G
VYESDLTSAHLRSEPQKGRKSIMINNDEGINKLIAAEQAGQQVIQIARQHKATKIKQAQQEAAKEIEQYKAAREKQYKAMMESGKGDAAERLETLEFETKAAIEKLEMAVALKKEAATQAILGWVTKVY